MGRPGPRAADPLQGDLPPVGSADDVADRKRFDRARPDGRRYADSLQEARREVRGGDITYQQRIWKAVGRGTAHICPRVMVSIVEPEDDRVALVNIVAGENAALGTSVRGVRQGLAVRDDVTLLSIGENPVCRITVDGSKDVAGLHVRPMEVVSVDSHRSPQRMQSCLPTS